MGPSCLILFCLGRSCLDSHSSESAPNEVSKKEPLMNERNSGTARTSLPTTSQIDANCAILPICESVTEQEHSKLNYSASLCGTAESELNIHLESSESCTNVSMATSVDTPSTLDCQSSDQLRPEGAPTEIIQGSKSYLTEIRDMDNYKIPAVPPMLKLPPMVSRNVKSIASARKSGCRLDKNSLRRIFFSRKTISCSIIISANDKPLEENWEGQESVDLKLCRRQSLQPFSEKLMSLVASFDKIGEGGFSEVFRATLTSNDLGLNESSKRILKVMPLSSHAAKLNVESEYEISDCLSKICHNFVHLYDAWFVAGSYPMQLLDAWQRFRVMNPDDALNSNPGLASEEAEYCVLVMEDAGVPFESFKFKNVDQAVSVIKQIGGRNFFPSSYSVSCQRLKC